jgi:hypothetical protein
MSIALLPQVLLRILSDPIYSAKGSALTWVQLDTDLKIIADACRELAAIGAASGFEPYDNSETYSDTDPDYVSYNNNIYEYINPIPQSGITPGTDPLTWQLSSQGQFAHLQNTDQYLDFGGANQVSAAAIKAFIEAVYPYLMQGTNNLTEDLIFDLDNTYILSILNGDMDLNGNAIRDVVIQDSLGNEIFDGRNAFKSSGEIVLDLQNQYLYSGNKEVLRWGTGELNLADVGTTNTLNWFDRILKGTWGFDDGTVNIIKTPGTPVETDGNWRLKIDGDDLITEKRESGTWNEKARQSP